MKQVESDPVYVRRFRFGPGTVSATSSITTSHLARILGSYNASSTSFNPLVDSFRIKHLELCDTAGAAIALELLGANNSKGQEKVDTGTTNMPSRVVFTEKELANSQAGWWWYQMYGTSTPLFSTVTSNSSNAYLDVTLEFTLANGSVGPQTSTATGAAGNVYVNYLTANWIPITGFNSLNMN